MKRRRLATLAIGLVSGAGVLMVPGTSGAKPVHPAPVQVSANAAVHVGPPPGGCIQVHGKAGNVANAHSKLCASP